MSAAAPVTLDFSKSQPIDQQPAAAPMATGAAPVTLDFSKAQHIGGPTIGPQVTNENLHPEDAVSASDPFLKGALKISTPFARKAMDAVDKLREMENFTKEGEQAHPVQAFMGHIANKLEGFLFGNEQHPEAGIGTGKYGMLTNPALAAVEAAPGAAGMAGGAEDVLRGGKAAEEGTGVISKVKQGISAVRHGEEVAQEPAKAAVRTMVGADEETPLLEGHDTAADKMLKDVTQKEKAAYKAQDTEAGFDVKETRANLKDAEYKVKQPEIDDAARERLTKTITESKQSISEAEKKLSDAGIDPKAADTLFKQRKALEELKKGLVQHTSPDGESVNVDGLLNYAKKMRNNPKYGDRLEQIAGKEGADKFMAELQKAKDIGAHGLKTQKIAQMVGKWVAGGLVGGGAAGAGYELLK